MKLLLTSGGLTNKSIVDSLTNLTKRPFKDLKLAFIPTAANVEIGDKKFWLIKDLEVCKQLGFKEIDVVDISALPKKFWLPRLESANVLLVEGGNTFYLMSWINKSGLSRSLKSLLASRVYVGISAGSIVVTPSLILSQDKRAIVKDMGERVYEKGLGLVNFLVKPHVNSIYFPERTFANVLKESADIASTIYALDDNSALKIDGGKIEVVSEGSWKKFN